MIPPPCTLRIYSRNSWISDPEHKEYTIKPCSNRFTCAMSIWRSAGDKRSTMALQARVRQSSLAFGRNEGAGATAPPELEDFAFAFGAFLEGGSEASSAEAGLFAI
jgi:hypothetical protein